MRSFLSRHCEHSLCRKAATFGCLQTRNTVTCRSFGEAGLESHRQGTRLVFNRRRTLASQGRNVARCPYFVGAGCKSAAGCRQKKIVPTKMSRGDFYVWACTPSAGHWIRILRGLSQGCAFACAPLHQQQRHGAESPRAVREPSRYFDSRRLTRQCWRADQSRFKNGLRRRALAIISAFSPSFRASA